MKLITSIITLYAIFGIESAICFKILPSGPKNVFQVAINRNATQAEKLLRLGNFDELSKIQRLVAADPQQVTDLYDEIYIGTITVGTPGVVSINPVNFVTSFDLGVPSTNRYGKSGFVACIDNMHQLQFVDFLIILF